MVQTQCVNNFETLKWFWIRKFSKPTISLEVCRFPSPGEKYYVVKFQMPLKSITFILPCKTSPHLKQSFSFTLEGVESNQSECYNSGLEEWGGSGLHSGSSAELGLAVDGMSAGVQGPRILQQATLPNFWQSTRLPKGRWNGLAGWMWPAGRAFDTHVLTDI